MYCMIGFYEYEQHERAEWHISPFNFYVNTIQPSVDVIHQSTST